MEKESLFTYGNHGILRKWEMFESEKSESVWKPKELL